MIGEILGSIGNVVGGLLNRKSAKEANEINRQNAENNIAMQKQFAQEGIRWKVADARAAGVHPLYALGAQTASFAPVSVGATADTSLGNSIASAGQDLTRGINATRTVEERAAAQATTALQLEGLKLDNEIKKTQVASSLQRISQNQNPPLPAIGPMKDANVPFDHPESNKAEERPPLMLFGNRVLTPPSTSPMKAWEDQIGDDGPLSWLAQLAVGAHMIQHNFNQRFGLSLPSMSDNSIDAKAYRSRQSRQYRQR